MHRFITSALQYICVTPLFSGIDISPNPWNTYTVKKLINISGVAFALNIPLRAYEEKMLGRWQGKASGKIKRPLCMVLTLFSVLLIIGLVALTVVPQVTVTVSELRKKLPTFAENVANELDRLAKTYPDLKEEVSRLKQIDFNWAYLPEKIMGFLQNGAGDFLSSTFSVASGIISGTMNGIIAFIFALYVLSQKERLGDQGKRVIRACWRTDCLYRPDSCCRSLYRLRGGRLSDFN